MNIHFTSDNHFGHRNIIRFCGRLYGSVEEMDEDMIAKWNDQVKPNDRVYHLGDFTFYRDPDKVNEIFDRLNGNIYYVWGNHDHDARHTIKRRTVEQHNYLEVKIGHRRIVLFHYPMMEWNGSFRTTWHLHGHSHNQWPQSPWMRLDLSVDGHDMRPWALEELDKLMASRRKQEPSIYTLPVKPAALERADQNYGRPPSVLVDKT